MLRSLKQILQEKEETRKNIKRPRIEQDDEDWEQVDPNIQRFEVVEPILQLRFITFKGHYDSLSSVFLRFFTEQLLRKVWTEERNGSWSYDRGTKTINGEYFLYRSYTSS